METKTKGTWGGARPNTAVRVQVQGARSLKVMQ